MTVWRERMRRNADREEKIMLLLKAKRPRAYRALTGALYSLLIAQFGIFIYTTVVFTSVIVILDEPLLALVWFLLSAAAGILAVIFYVVDRPIRRSVPK